MKEMSDDLSHKFNEIASWKPHSRHKSRSHSSYTASKNKITDLDSMIQHQQKKITSLEAYSKLYNLNFFNIQETLNETTDILLQRLHHILQMMELDPASFYIDAIHRLP